MRHRLLDLKALSRRQFLLAGTAAITTVGNAVWSAATAQRRSEGRAQGDAPGARGELPAVRFRATAAQPAGTPVTFGHCFARGHLSPGSGLVAQAGEHEAAVAIDQVNAWPADKSVRCAALSFLLPRAVGRGETVTFRLAPRPALEGTPLTVAQIAAVSDIRLIVRGGDYAKDSFTVSVNDVLRDFKPWKGDASWGTDPVGGWEVIRSSPICAEVRVWRYLKRDGDGRNHRWVKAKIYVRLWSDGKGGVRGLQVLPGLFQENSYGPHPRGEVGDPRTPLAHAGQVSLYDGGKLLVSYRGPSGANPKTMPQRGWWGALPDGTRPWVGLGGAPKPAYMVAHDVVYTTRRTRCLPPYDYAAAERLPAAVKDLRSDPGYTVNVSRLQSDIDTTGNDLGDDRYGYLNVHSAALLLNPLDPEREKAVLAYGWSWADWEQWICDERTGWIVNTGTDSSTCPSPANPGFCMHWNTHLGSPAWMGFGPQDAVHGWNYAQYMETSHLPALWIMPYLRTGDEAFAEMALFTSASTTASVDEGARNFTYDGTHYENVMLGFYQGGGRVAGHFIRIQGAADRLIRDDHPCREFVRRVMDENAKCAAKGIPWSDPAMAHLGVFYTKANDKSDNYASMFMEEIYAFQFAFEDWAGDRPGFGAQLRRMQPLVVGTYDQASGGDGFNLTVYHLTVTDGTKPYADVAAVRRANFPNDPGPHAHGFRDPVSQQATIAFIPLASILMQGWLDQPIPRAHETGDALLARYRAPPVGGLDFTKQGQGFFPTWAFASRTAG